MLSKFIEEGCKLELRAIERSAEEVATGVAKVYHSQVLEMISDDTMEIAMPIEQGKLILLPVDGEYDMVFYCGGGLYQAFARIADRYKSNNVYILVMELTTNLRKYQRREFYRFSCALDMCARVLGEEELRSLEQKNEHIDSDSLLTGSGTLTEELSLKQSIIVDISGGGLRFVSTQQYEPGQMLLCSYELLKNGVRKHYDIVGRVLAVRELEYRKGSFEHRVQYYNLDVGTREEIIRFIFEEERKNRQKEMG